MIVFKGFYDSGVSSEWALNSLHNEGLLAVKSKIVSEYLGIPLLNRRRFAAFSMNYDGNRFVVIPNGQEALLLSKKDLL